MAETAPGFRQQLQLGYDNWEEALPTLSKRVSRLEGKLKGLRDTAANNLKELQNKFDTAEKVRTEEAKQRKALAHQHGADQHGEAAPRGIRRGQCAALLDMDLRVRLGLRHLLQLRVSDSL